MKHDKIISKNKKIFESALLYVHEHPMFKGIFGMSSVSLDESKPYPEFGYALVGVDGDINLNPYKSLTKEQYSYVIVHCLLHLVFDHFSDKWKKQPFIADILIRKFLEDFKFGESPTGEYFLLQGVPDDELKLINYFQFGDIKPHFKEFGMGDYGGIALTSKFKAHNWNRRKKEDWVREFSIGLKHAVASAINVAAGVDSKLGITSNQSSKANQARNWFVSHYPLLGSLASSFVIIEDKNICDAMDIKIAAVNIQLKEIYIQPSINLNLYELRFVIAHELLHAGLRHDTRRQGRDPFLWNVACDYVINDWLIQMKIGDMPADALFDIELRDYSSEEIYDKIAMDLRRQRKLATLAGIKKCDMIEPNHPNWFKSSEGCNLDAFYRRCLMQGLQYHYTQERGFVPAGLVESINALEQPAIDWDIELAKWFDRQFSPLDKYRTYARPSRRQSSNQNIPLPRYTIRQDEKEKRIFAVLLDTSGSMDRTLLAKALGSIVSYSVARDVYKVRLVYCDANAYDQGYVEPDQLAQSVKVIGRGGTVLQPGIQLLEKADDFPDDAPILIITDGGCDVLRVHHPHGYLIPAYGSLPFKAKGEVFRVE